LSDFSGYARTNLFKTRDVDEFWDDVLGLSLPISRLQDKDLVGLIWTGQGQPFSEEALKQLVPVVLTHAEEPVFFIIAGAIRGESPLLECTVVDPKSKKVTRNTLQDLTKGKEVNLSPAAVIWEP